MRFLKAVLLMAALVASASAAHAANVTFGLGGGIAAPTRDFGKDTNLGYGGSVYGDYWIRDDTAFGADIAADFFKAKDEFIRQLQDSTHPNPDEKTTLINFGVHGTWAPPVYDSPIPQPWISFGAGLYHLTDKLTGSSEDRSSSVNKLGINGGVGVDFGVGAATKAGLDVKYHYVPKAIGGGSSGSAAATYLTAEVRITFMTGGGE